MNKKILFIDDNVEITDLVSRYLKFKKYDVTVINDPKIGMDLLLNQKYDVVILDISMPYVNGFHIISQLMNKNLIKIQKLIVLTAVDLTVSDIKSMFNVGIHSCLMKPVNMNQLIDSIESPYPNMVPQV